MTTQIENRIRLNLVRQIDDSYDVVVGTNLFPQIAAELKRDCPKVSKFAIITDSNVGPLYAPELLNAFRNKGLECLTLTFPAGEENKNMNTVNNLLNDLGSHRYNRDSLILALGGGVVGDTAGLVASLLNRGVQYVGIPTTTLSQADSAVGGKTGVDLPSGKNLAGAFKQPFRDYIDVRTTRTLDMRNFRSGLSETIKHGVIRDLAFFEWLEQNMDTILAKDEASLIYMAQQNSRIKGTVVEIDPNEKGLRKILNWGHTLGHAIETASRYTLLHGEAVALGMMAEAIIANRINGFPIADIYRQNKLLERLKGPVKIPGELLNKDILDITLSDKKASGGKVNYCLPNKLGEMNDYDGKYATAVPIEDIIIALDSIR